MVRFHEILAKTYADMSSRVEQPRVLRGLSQSQTSKAPWESDPNPLTLGVLKPNTRSSLKNK